MEEIFQFLSFLARVIFQFLLFYIGFIMLRVLTFNQYPKKFKEMLLFPYIIFIDFIGIITLVLGFYLLAQI